MSVTNRPMKHVSELWKTTVGELFGQSVKAPSEVSQKMNYIHRNIADCLESGRLDAEGIRDRDKRCGQWIEELRSMEGHYSFLHSKWQKVIEAESYALNIERRANISALFFRVMTTVFVGLTIMGIYALAHYLCIPMPLMRMPI